MELQRRLRLLHQLHAPVDSASVFRDGEEKIVSTKVKKGKKKKKELKSHSALREQAEQAALEAVEQQNALQEAGILADFSNQIGDFFDETGELGGIGEGSWIENEVSRRYILEAAVLQRSKLVCPNGLREAKSHSTLPISICCPQAIRDVDLIKVLGDEEGDLNYQSEIHWDRSRSRGWEVLSSIKGNRPSLFTHRTSGIVQTQEPFDLSWNKQRKHLRAELR